MTLFLRPAWTASGAASLLLYSLGSPALSQTSAPATDHVTTLPSIEVTAPRRATPPRRPKKPVVTGARREEHDVPPSDAQVLAGKNEKFDEARHSIVAPDGANTFAINHQAIEALPQGSNTTLDKVLLQAPGVSQDGREWRATRPQRARQFAVPHQRYRYPRRRRRFRPIPGFLDRRQARPVDRRAARAIRASNRRRPRYPD